MSLELVATPVLEVCLCLQDLCARALAGLPCPEQAPDVPTPPAVSFSDHLVCTGFPGLTTFAPAPPPGELSSSRRSHTGSSWLPEQGGLLRTQTHSLSAASCVQRFKEQLCQAKPLPAYSAAWLCHTCWAPDRAVPPGLCRPVAATYAQAQSPAPDSHEVQDTQASKARYCPAPLLLWLALRLCKAAPAQGTCSEAAGQPW